MRTGPPALLLLIKLADQEADLNEATKPYRIKLAW
jgi:hypothetical protein